MPTAPTPRRPSSNCRWGFYGIVDGQPAPSLGRPSGLELARLILNAGGRVIQLRDKRLPFEELAQFATALRALTREYAAALIINDNPYLAQAVGADGVHLGQLDLPVDIAREIVGRDAIIGLSTHSKQQAIQATYQAVDYIGVGPVFPTATKANEYSPVGSGLVRWVHENLPLPQVAIGGIDGARFDEVLHSGADNIAVIGGLVNAQDVEAQARDFVARFERRGTPAA